MEQLQGKVAIVTGGASGIGKALGQQLVKQGAKVVIGDINIDNVDNAGGRVQAIKVDVSQADQVQNLVDQTVQEHGRLDYMFNNAGFALSGEIRDLSLEQWNRILDVNLKGVIHGVQAAYPAMIKQGYGHIVNTASLAGLIPSPTLAAYSTTKFAVVGLSLALRSEAAGLGVKVSALCPGFIQTGIYDAGVYVKSRKEDMMANMAFKLMDVDKSAELMMRGIAKNRAIITMPTYAYIFWGLQRISPALGGLLGRKIVSDFRKVRIESPPK